MQTHNGMLVRHKEGRKFSICDTWMGLEAIMLSKICQKEIEKSSYKWSIEYNTKTKQTHRYREKVGGSLIWGWGLGKMG